MTALRRATRPHRHPRLRIFSEARLHRGSDAVMALDPASGPAIWAQYVDRIGDVELVARVGPATDEARIPLDGIDVFPLPYYHGLRQLLLRSPFVVVKLARAVSGSRLLLFRMPGILSMTGAVIARGLRRPYVAEVVGDPYDVLRSGVAGRVGIRVAQPLARLMAWLVRGAEAVRYVTDASLQERYPARRGVSVHAYSNVQLTDADFVEKPRNVESAPVAPRIVAVGSQDQLYKGHQDLIAAVARLNQAGLRCELTLIGAGQYQEYLKSLASRVGAADATRFLGRIEDRAELRAQLDSADVFCMPSHTEGMPRALLEALARGVPSIGTTVGGMPEVLPEASLVAPGDVGGLAELIKTTSQSAEHLKRASEDGWNRAQAFRASRLDPLRHGWLAELDALSGPAQHGQST